MWKYSSSPYLDIDGLLKRPNGHSSVIRGASGLQKDVKQPQSEMTTERLKATVNDAAVSFSIC